jgi:hypothetical protein
MALFGGLFSKDIREAYNPFTDQYRIGGLTVDGREAANMSKQELDQMLANAAQQAYQPQMYPSAQPQMYPSAPPVQKSYERTVFGMQPIESKARDAITTVVSKLPMKLAASIASINFEQTEHVNGQPTGQHYNVIFVGGKVVKFDNVDTFPLEEDVARIALEAP